jgi:hypothetical protein
MGHIISLYQAEPRFAGGAFGSTHPRATHTAGHNAAASNLVVQTISTRCAGFYSPFASRSRRMSRPHSRRAIRRRLPSDVRTPRIVRPSPRMPVSSGVVRPSNGYPIGRSLRTRLAHSFLAWQFTWTIGLPGSLRSGRAIIAAACVERHGRQSGGWQACWPLRSSHARVRWRCVRRVRLCGKVCLGNR